MESITRGYNRNFNQRLTTRQLPFLLHISLFLLRDKRSEHATETLIDFKRELVIVDVVQKKLITRVLLVHRSSIAFISTHSVTIHFFQLRRVGRSAFTPLLSPKVLSTKASTDVFTPTDQFLLRHMGSQGDK